MKKIHLLLFLLCLPVFSFGQNQSYKGFYQTKFFNFLGDVKVIEAEFEVKDDNTITGKLKLGNETKILQGAVESKGKFEARTAAENGVVTLIKGEFPITKNEGKVSLIQRSEQKGNGSKSSSETGVSGFIKQMPTPVELKDVGIVDDGKTQLWFQHSSLLFGKEWIDFPATATISQPAGIKAIEVLMRLKTEEAERRFRFRMSVKQEAQKVWLGTDLAISIYAESKKSADGKNDISLFFNGTAGNILGGQVEIISENESEIVIKITNLRIKRLNNEDFVKIDGFIHAVKAQ